MQKLFDYPLKKDVKTIAVIGPLANSQADQLGSWVSNGRAEDAVTPLEGIKTKLPHSEVLYAKGVEIMSMEKQPLGGPAPAPATATGVAGTGSGGGSARWGSAAVGDAWTFCM